MRASPFIVCDPPERITPAPYPGEVVGGKYRLLRPLGEGGMGLVFEAEHLRLRQAVAIKFLRPDVLAMPDAVERFEREARTSVRMRGPHVVQVLDVDSDAEGRPYMVMERLRGRDLECELQARGPLPISLAVDWVLQACAAVSDAHAEGIVHRDLKPSNLFLAEDRGVRIVKVLDFGISKLARDAEPSVTAASAAVGTPLYMSPEQLRSSKDVDGRTDIWSLGVILYELVAGAPPFLGTTTAAIAAIVADATPSIRSVRPDVPLRLERAILTALAKAPSDRFPTAEALAAALMPFASAEGMADPFSLRPSRQAYAVASSTMARTPPAARVSDACELLRLPSRRHDHPTEFCTADAVKTFAGALAVGMAIATTMTWASSRDQPRAPVETRAAGDALASPPEPREALVIRGPAIRPVAVGTVASRPHALLSAGSPRVAQPGGASNAASPRRADDRHVRSAEPIRIEPTTPL